MGWLMRKARQSGGRTVFWRDSNVRFWRFAAPLRPATGVQSALTGHLIVGRAHLIVSRRWTTAA